jgi:hypothetical protein
MASNTRTLQQSVEWASFFLGRRPFYGLDPGSTLEPALTTANVIIQTMLQPPFKWRWNRNNASFVMMSTTPWAPNTPYGLGYRLRDTNGNMQTATVGGISGPIQPVWPTVQGETVVDNTITWTTSNSNDYLLSIPDFGFIEKATITTTMGNLTGTIKEIPNIETNLSRDLGVGQPNTIAPVFDDNEGNLTFRFMPGIPDQAYSVNILYQKAPVLLTGVYGAGGTWPIPDSYGHVYDNGVLFYFLLYAGDSRAFAIGQKFASNLIALSEGLDEQAKAIFLGEWETILTQAARGQYKMQLANDGRTR